jgi:hypothetical protein
MSISVPAANIRQSDGPAHEVRQKYEVRSPDRPGLQLGTPLYLSPVVGVTVLMPCPLSECYQGASRQGRPAGIGCAHAARCRVELTFD